MQHLILIAAVSLLVGLFCDVATAQECPGSHCSAKSDAINNICKANGQSGNLVFVQYPAGTGQFCYCRCSCLPPETPVAIAPGKWQEMGRLKVGDSVIALQRDGSWKAAPVVFSEGTTMPEKPIPYAIFVAFSNDVALVATPSHAFLLADGTTLKRADRLAPSDEVMDANTMRPVTITKLYSGSYQGPMHNIVATQWNQNDDQWSHLINTNGIVSADYFAQLYLARDLDQNAPQVGSDAYAAKFGASPSLRGAPKEIKLNGDARFIPHRRLEIPSNALPFLEPGQDQAAPGTLHPLDYTVPYEMAEYIVRLYKAFYTDINFHVEWNDDRVSAFAWMDGNARHVALLGGLLRNRVVQQEGAGLVLAHEIGHHFGGPPRYSSGNTWASCEGQSDYWGALIGQRNVWWGQQALDQTRKGSQQLYDLFSNGLMMGNLVELSKKQSPATTGICSHPPAYCRFETYQAALRLDPKPTCAGDPGVK